METQTETVKNDTCPHCGELFEYCPHQNYGEPVLEKANKVVWEIWVGDLILCRTDTKKFAYDKLKELLFDYSGLEIVEVRE